MGHGGGHDQSEKLILTGGMMQNVQGVATDCKMCDSPKRGKTHDFRAICRLCTSTYQTPTASYYNNAQLAFQYGEYQLHPPADSTGNEAAPSWAPRPMSLNLVPKHAAHRHDSTPEVTGIQQGQPTDILAHQHALRNPALLPATPMPAQTLVH